MKRKLYISLILLFSGITLASGQTDIARAWELFSAKKVDSAKIYIDLAKENPVHAESDQFWMLRGFIYKELYKLHERADKKSRYRFEAVRCYKYYYQYLGENPDAEQKQSVDASVNWLATQYYNDAGKYLAIGQVGAADRYYNKHFKELRTIAYPNTDFNKFDIEFKLALGAAYVDQWEEADPDENICDEDQGGRDSIMKKAIRSYEEVLAIDSNNCRANKELALMYYNHAVHLTHALDTLEDIFCIPVIQDKIETLAKKGTPHMLKAWSCNPEKYDENYGMGAILWMRYECEAKQYVVDAYDLRRESCELLYWLYEIELHCGDLSKAKDWLDQYKACKEEQKDK